MHITADERPKIVCLIDVKGEILCDKDNMERW